MIEVVMSIAVTGVVGFCIGYTAMGLYMTWKSKQEETNES